MTKNFYLYDKFFESNRNLTKHVKIVKITGFARFFLPKLSNSRFPGKVATLLNS